MEEIKFKSQICTTMEQSKRLLELGLKPETADMLHYKSSSMKEWGILATPYDLGRGFEKVYQPAWSLHRLIELYRDVEDTSLLMIKDVSINLLIFCIEKAIRCNVFNKQYLNK